MSLIGGVRFARNCITERILMERSKAGILTLQTRMNSSTRPAAGAPLMDLDSHALEAIVLELCGNRGIQLF
jgi:hypothetical protein